ncbi:hypothetical protein EOL96_09330 [Candidatus Saccharibacteria bacterium]|nr:hypothetical protein [Candidatus Saccharibacteria bacterium]
MDPQQPTPPPPQQPQPQEPQQPQPEQYPTAPPRPEQQYAQPPATPPENPGKTLGIIGIVLGILPLGVIGIILSILSTVKSSKANASKTLGIIGIVLNSLNILGTVFLVLITMTAYDGIRDRSDAAYAEANARTVLMRAETYYTINNTYPSTSVDFDAHPQSSLSGESFDLTTQTPSAADVQYVVCGENNSGAAISYYDAVSRSTQTMYAGDGDMSCL